jgi:hypothetical protein
LAPLSLGHGPPLSDGTRAARERYKSLVSREFRQELQDFGWIFSEEGKELIAALQECAEKCDYSPAREVMEAWLRVLGASQHARSDPR